MRVEASLGPQTQKWGPEGWGPVRLGPEKWAPEGWGPKGWGAFFFFSRHNFLSFFSLSLVVPCHAGRERVGTARRIAVSPTAIVWRGDHTLPINRG